MSEEIDTHKHRMAAIQTQLAASTCMLRIATISTTIEYLRRRFEATRQLSDFDKKSQEQCRQWLALATDLDHERTQLIGEIQRRKEALV